MNSTILYTLESTIISNRTLSIDKP